MSPNEYKQRPNEHGQVAGTSSPSTTEWAQTSGNEHEQRQNEPKLAQMSTSEHEQRPNENDQVAGTNKDTTMCTNKRKRVRLQRQEWERVRMSARVNERSEWWARTFAEGGCMCNTSGGHSNNGSSTTSTGGHNSST